MKKLLVVLLIVCIAFAGVVTYMNKDAIFAKQEEATEKAEPSEVIEEPLDASGETAAPAPEVHTLDYEAIYALHDPEEIVMTVDGEDITWDEYFSWFHMNGADVENYFNNMANYYGMAVNWDEPISDDPEETYATYVVDGVENNLLQLASIQGLADKNNLKLSQESLDAIEAQKASDMASMCGEGATEEDFKAALAADYMTESAYNRMNTVNYVYQENFTNIYGQDGKKVSDEKALKYLEDNSYISANHILLMTVDPATGEALDESAMAEKKATADKLYAELSKITDPEKLEKRFIEMKEEYCEDTGKTNYPEGYVFTPGTMVEVFESTCNSLGDYEVSEPVLSNYGYHIILRLPNSPDRVMEYSNAGTPLSARSVCANELYAKDLEDYMAGVKLEYAEGFEIPDVLSFVK